MLSLLSLLFIYFFIIPIETTLFFSIFFFARNGSHHWPWLLFSDGRISRFGWCMSDVRDFTAHPFFGLLDLYVSPKSLHNYKKGKRMHCLLSIKWLTIERIIRFKTFFVFIFFIMIIGIVSID
jgi:hypothetical protein